MAVVTLICGGLYLLHTWTVINIPPRLVDRKGFTVRAASCQESRRGVAGGFSRCGRSASAAMTTARAVELVDGCGGSDQRRAAPRPRADEPVPRSPPRSR